MSEISERKIYYINEIHRPDITTNGIIPSIGSIVIDDTDPSNRSIHQVKSVDPVTKESTLVLLNAGYASQSNNKLDKSKSSIINYGNTRFYLYYDITNSPTKIFIDNKVVLYGTSNTHYRLRKYTKNGLVTISKHMTQAGDYLGEYVPLSKVDSDGYKKICTHCHTNVPITPDDTVLLEVVKEDKSISTTIELFCSPIKNTLFTSTPRVITGIDVEASQELSNDVFYMHPNQDKATLNMIPKLTYSNGDVSNLGIDGAKVIMYGYDEFTPSYPGQETSILVKYILNDGESIHPNLGDKSYIQVSKKIKVVNDKSDKYNVKISVVPRYDNISNKYVLMFFMYCVETKEVYNVTGLVELLTPYDGDFYDGYQHVKFSLKLNNVFNTENDMYIQSIQLKLAPPSYVERYIIKDSENDDYGIYGVDAGNNIRPLIDYNSAEKKYFISNIRFANKDIFLENFYKKARPLYKDELVIPTHFTMRDPVTNNLIVSSPISVDEYIKPWSSLLDTSYVGSTVVVEFLTKDDDTYDTIYGVPVDIK